MSNLLCVILIAAGLVLGSSCNSKQGSVPAESGSVESRVYGSLISIYQDRLGSSNLLVLDETTHGVVKPDSSLGDVVQFLEKRLSSHDKDQIIRGFREANEVPGEMIRIDSDHMHLIVSKRVIRDDENAEAVVVSFSKIGFNSDRNLALVYMGYQNGSRSGSGYYTVLKLEGQRWLPEEKILAWVS